jgi:hypothetical protein
MTSRITIFYAASDWQSNSRLRERPRQPDEVRRLVDEMPADHRQHFTANIS